MLPRPGREYVLRTALEDIRGEYDVILLDCSPSLGVVQTPRVVCGTKRRPSDTGMSGMP